MKVIIRFKVGEIAIQVQETPDGRFLLEHYVGEDLHYSKHYKSREGAMRDFDVLKRETLSGDAEPQFHLLRGHH